MSKIYIIYLLNVDVLMLLEGKMLNKLNIKYHNLYMKNDWQLKLSNIKSATSRLGLVLSFNESKDWIVKKLKNNIITESCQLLSPINVVVTNIYWFDR